jgi:dihydroorotate dehydrogenase electron transfer subunit
MNNPGGLPMNLNHTIQSAMRLNEDTYLLRILSPEIANSAKPGQFVNVKCCSGLNAYLRRPISICAIDREAKTFDIVFQVRGKGTELLCQFQEQDEINIMGPLGNGFSLCKEDETILVMGGGIGIFPLLQLLREHPAKQKIAVLGFRTKGLIVLEEAFKAACNELLIATDDGSFGHKGFVTDILQKKLSEERVDKVFMCGPAIMMKKGVGLCHEKGIPTQVSMEQRMGCGIGACLVCACKTRKNDDWDYAHVCKDGPVFDGAKIIFD